MMKKTIQSLLAATFFTISSAQAAQLGINYDPLHSLDFIKGVGLDDKEMMIKAIERDLDKLKEFRQAEGGAFHDVRQIKTFYATFSSSGAQGTPVKVHIADVVNQWNNRNSNFAVKLSLGVYEFRPKDGCANQEQCKQWTQIEVDSAIEAIRKYGPALIENVVVGNENLGNKDPDVSIIRQRVLADINELKKVDPSIPIGTAQRTWDVRDMLKDKKSPNKAILDSANFIGVNLYPFWEGKAYSNAKGFIDNYWKKEIGSYLKTKPILMTEEGWPSAGAKKGSAQPSGVNAYKYLKYWIARNHDNTKPNNKQLGIPTSYYFALFDKLPSTGNSVESHWGIYSANRHSSLLEGKHDKPLSNDIRLISFANATGKKIIINACAEDMGTSQGKCYPIYGRASSSTADVKKTNLFMVDTSGSHYKSLMVVYKENDSLYPRLCYLNSGDLKALKNKQTLTLKLTNPGGDGAVVCGK